MSQDEITAYPTPLQSGSQRKSKKRPREATVEQTPTKKLKKSDNSKEGRKPRSSLETARSALPGKNAVRVGDKHTQTHEHSPFFAERVSLYITLSPVAYDFALEGAIAEHISPLLLTYYPPLNGVVLAFDNAALSSRPDEQGNVLGQSIDEYAVTYLWLSADFLVFRPSRGAVLEGVVNLQNESMLGLLCYNYFNAAIEREHVPADWTWVEENNTQDHANGHFVDGDSPIEGLIPFKAKDFEAALNDGGVATINISGSLFDGAGQGDSIPDGV